MRDVAPEGLVAGTEMDRRPQAFTLHIQPDFPELVGCQLAPLARLVDLALECIKGDLANRRVEHVLDLLSDKRLALSRRAAAEGPTRKD